MPVTDRIAAGSGALGRTGAHAAPARVPAGDPLATIASTRAAIERSSARCRESVDTMNRMVAIIRR